MFRPWRRADNSGGSRFGFRGSHFFFALAEIPLFADKWQARQLAERQAQLGGRAAAAR